MYLSLRPNRTLYLALRPTSTPRRPEFGKVCGGNRRVQQGPFSVPAVSQDTRGDTVQGTGVPEAVMLTIRRPKRTRDDKNVRRNVF